ncbi:hypothetical protein WJX72_002091 [[Myrmecia] bisecta]|uniref:Uncharacterized protein n=1 Tax=[Myrmecia] bisecta TaxID=41462 RepID=A0AAW1Q1L5_9CHLO
MWTLATVQSSIKPDWPVPHSTVLQAELHWSSWPLSPQLTEAFGEIKPWLLKQRVGADACKHKQEGTAKSTQGKRGV